MLRACFSRHGKVLRQSKGNTSPAAGAPGNSASLLCLLLFLAAAAGAEAAPFAFCRFVPERKDDFAFENDRVAFRVYGPALRGKGEDSGIDCWAKSVDYPIIDKWYAGDLREKKSYHQDHGEGLDFYKVGATRGCGGIAIWQDGKIFTSGVFQAQRVIRGGPEEAVFELTYTFEVDGETITEVRRVTLQPGSNLARADAVFTKNGQPVDLTIGIGLATGQGPGEKFFDVKAGWMAVWETFQKQQLGVGVVVNPSVIETSLTTEQDPVKGSHAWLVVRTGDAGRLTWFFGFGWEGSGQFPTMASWKVYLAKFAADYAANPDFQAPKEQP